MIDNVNFSDCSYHSSFHTRLDPYGMMLDILNINLKLWLFDYFFLLNKLLFNKKLFIIPIHDLKKQYLAKWLIFNYSVYLLFIFIYIDLIKLNTA